MPVTRIRHHVASTIAIAAVAAIAAPTVAGAAPAATRLQVIAPATATVGHDLSIDVRVAGARAGAVAGFQVDALVDGDAARVVTAIPGISGARILDPASAGGSASVGFFGGRPGSAREGLIAHILVTPNLDGRLQVRLADPILVDASGHRLPVHLTRRLLTIRVGSNLAAHFRAPRPPASPPARARTASSDVTGDGSVSAADLATAYAAWQSASGGARACQGAGRRGDVTGDSCTDVGDLQVLAAAVPSAIALPASGARPSGVRPAFGPPGMTWVVNSTDDLPDAAPGDRICLTSAGTCSLRAAIDEANRRAGDDLITFAIPGGAPQTIQLTGVLTYLNAKVGSLMIDGYSEPGAHANTDPIYDNAQAGVVLRGYSTSDRKAMGLYVTSPGNIIRGLAFESLGRDIDLFGPAATGNQIVGNWFGLGGTGQLQSYNAGYANIMLDGSPGNFIGGPALEDRNVVVGGFDGIVTDNPGADGNVYQNNLLGVSLSGVVPQGGTCTGIDFNVGPKHNQVGGLEASERNVIDAYQCDGVEFSHGWNQTTGDSSLPYQVNDNLVVGNYIGIRADGTFTPTFMNAYNNNNANDGSGVNIWDIANHNTVQANAIAAFQNGVQIAHNTNDNVIVDNLIGVLPNGDPSNIGQNGILIHSSSSGEQILRNAIANTGLAGIAIVDTNNDFNRISQNTFWSNGTLAIDLAPLGVVNPNDINDVDTGANQQINFPIIASATTTSVSGTSQADNTVELFLSRAGAPDQNGPGQTYLTSTTADSLGSWSAAVSLQPGDIVTTTATDDDGNTSEFGPNVAVPGAPPTIWGVTYEDYRNVTGSKVTDIPAGTQPAATSTMESFRAPLDRGNNLGTHMTALVSPPTTGDYTFWISSDDASQLYLSPTESPSARMLIARVTSSAAEGVWDKEANQQSAVFTLQAGQRYYLDAYSKEATGEDHLEVAWSGPGFGRQIVGGQSVSPTTSGCSGWCPNGPNDGHGIQFDDFQGWNGALLSNIPQGTLPTASSILVGPFAAAVNRGNRFGTRMRALLTAPVAGDYTFWISSDDEGKLYVSPSTDPTLEQMVARVVGSIATAAAFDVQATQKSAPIHLAQGQQVFIEAYQKDNTGNDHLEVAWTIPGFGRAIVPLGVLTPSTAGCAGWCPK